MTVSSDGYARTVREPQGSGALDASVRGTPGPTQLAPRASGPTGLLALVTSVASDSHNWNLVYLELLLAEMGHQVVNLGPCVPDDLLAAECRRLGPDLAVVSTVNGHGYLDGMRLIRRLRAQPELAALPVVIGGKLGIAGPSGWQHCARLVSAGFDAVFEDGTDIGQFRAFVTQLAASVSR